MATQNAKLIDTIVKRLLDHIDTHYTQSDISLFKQFTQLYYQHAPTPDIQQRSTAQLFGLVRNHLSLFRQASTDHENMPFTIYNPSQHQHGWESTHTVLQLVVDDMPFIVDSIRMEIDRLKLPNFLMIFTGGIWVQRNAEQKVTGLSSRYSFDPSTASEGWKIESPIHTEIGRQTDPAKLFKLESNIMRVMSDVREVTRDWEAMCTQVQSSIQSLQEPLPCVETEEVEESIAYLRWLLDDHFTFLGMRDYTVEEHNGDKVLKLVVGSGLGVLKDDSSSRKTRFFHELAAEVQKMMLSNKHVLVISKTNTLSTVHRVGYTDYVGIKQFDQQGNLLGERRFIGLYTSAAYNSAPRSIPLLRRKVMRVLKESGFPSRSHSGKDLMHILRTLPRDDLFQSSVNELLDLSLGILHMQERRQVRLFVRKDVYGRFTSSIVFIPRERFSSDLIKKVERILVQGFNGTECSFTTNFSSPVLTQIHFLIRVDNNICSYDVESLESQIIAASANWDDELKASIMQFFGE